MLGISRWWIVARVLVAKILVATFLTLLLVMSSAGSSNAMGVSTLAHPTLAIAGKTKRAEPPKSSAKLAGKLSEAAPPDTIQALRQELDNYQPQVTILSPRKNEVLQDNTISVKFQVNDLPIFKDKKLGLGPHLHVLLDNSLYQAVYDLNQPLVLQNLEPGTHTLRAFASRPWHESFKNEGAYAQATFHVYTQTEDNNPNPDLPLLTYSRPQGSYGAEPIMLDFYLTNAPLHLVAQEDAKDDIADWRIRCTINGESFVLDRWLPTYLKGLKPGKNWVQLEFLDEKGNPIKNVFNNTVRVVTYEPGGKDTLSQLIRGELSVAEAKGIVDPNYVPPEPQPAPTPQSSPSPLPSVSPAPVIPLPANTPKASTEASTAPKAVQPTSKTTPSSKAKLGAENPSVMPRQKEATPTPSSGESKVSKPADEKLELAKPTPVASPSPKPAEPTPVESPAPVASPAPKSEVKPTKPFGFDRFRNPFQSAPISEQSKIPAAPKPAATPSPEAAEPPQPTPVASPVPLANPTLKPAEPTPKSEAKSAKPFGLDRFRNPLKSVPTAEPSKIPAAPKPIEKLAAPQPAATPVPVVAEPLKPTPVASPAPVVSPAPVASPAPKSEAKPAKPFGFDRFRNPLKSVPTAEPSKIPAAPKPIEKLAAPAPQPAATPVPVVAEPLKPTPVASPAPVVSPAPVASPAPKSEVKPTKPFGFDRFRNPFQSAPISEQSKIPAAPKPAATPSPEAAEPPQPTPVASPVPLANPTLKPAEPTPKSEAKPAKPFGLDRFRNPLKSAPTAEPSKIPAAPKPIEKLAAPKPAAVPSPAVSPLPVASPVPKPAETPKSEAKPAKPFGFDRFRNPLKSAPTAEPSKIPAAPKPVEKLAAPKPAAVPSPAAAESAKPPELSAEKKEGIPARSFASPAPVRPLPSPSSMKLSQPAPFPSSSVTPKPAASSTVTPTKSTPTEPQLAPLPTAKATEPVSSSSQEIQNPGFGQFFDRLHQNVSNPTVSVPSGS